MSARLALGLAAGALGVLATWALGTAAVLSWAGDVLDGEDPFGDGTEAAELLAVQVAHGVYRCPPSCTAQLHRPPAPPTSAAHQRRHPGAHLFTPIPEA